MLERTLLVVNPYQFAIPVKDHLNQGVMEESYVAGCGERFVPLFNLSRKIIYKPLNQSITRRQGHPHNKSFQTSLVFL